MSEIDHYEVTRIEVGTLAEFNQSMAERLPRETAPETICDFCCRGEGVWLYPAKDFMLGQTVTSDGYSRDQWSFGSWSACATCGAFIEADDYEGLVRYRGQGEPGIAFDVVRRIFSNFRAMRIGARITAADRARCQHPPEGLRVAAENLTINPRHHPGVICSHCGANLEPQLYFVPDAQHRTSALRVAR